MHLVRFDQPLVWGELDVSLLGIVRDWDGSPVSPPAAYSLAVDPQRLWFIATRSQPAELHPKARPGRFQAELWKHDVAELFLHDPARGHYVEFNLAPNGAWWSCEFSSPRVRVHPEDQPWPGVETFAELAPDGGWVAAMAIPLESLKDQLHLGPDTTANVAFIINSPDQQFLTAAPLGGGEPDFHRPAAFTPLRVHEGSLPGAEPNS
ncbi:hypothetical protein [Haloferula rosea]|uniref:Carbohydrate-binding domain-containing protein n=1 Tax=Haloferula rosea TaxID=490093 RepID=A0A934RC33_9BACT|nr:hypothetical protein [Haloferula rosea]MBK1827918.1 hypothetical protein [Haloferula rosea]